jgi:predicted ester cyclase
MSAEQTRRTMEQYAEALVARGDLARHFSADVELSIAGSELRAEGPEAAEQAIRDLHERAFDASPEIMKVLVGDGEAALEAVFVGTHTGEFAGVAATGNAVRVPYAVFYDVDGDKISALRIYMPMEELIRQAQGAASGAA